MLLLEPTNRLTVSDERIASTRWIIGNLNMPADLLRLQVMTRNPSDGGNTMIAIAQACNVPKLEDEPLGQVPPVQSDEGKPHPGSVSWLVPSAVHDDLGVLAD